MKKIIIFPFLLATFLTYLWFKGGYILGTAEDGLIFYNLSNYYHQAEKTWMVYPGLGSPALSLIATKPTYFVLSYFQQIGIPGFLIQGVLIWFLLFSSSIGITLLVRELFPKLPSKYTLLSILFYWFNPISMVDVWNRFLLNYIFFFALLPIGSYLYIKGLISKKYHWLVILNLTFLLYSYAFSYIAFTILFWIWLLLITLYFILFNKTKVLRLFFAKYFLLSLIIFCITNSWWVLTLIKLNVSGGSVPTASLFISQNNTGLLDALSKSSASLMGIMKLLNTSFLSPDSLSWVRFYYSPVLYIFQYAIFGMILYFIAKNRNKPLVLILASLFFSIVFLAKGSNPPFGEIYTFIFQNVLILQVFRNPFEKFGFILSLMAAVLLAPSIFELNNLENNLKKLIYPIIFVFILFFLGLPFFSELVFTNKFPPTNNYSIGYKVQVPQYYKEVSEWLNRKGDNFRYIGFPIKDEGTTYNWEKGYSGVELPVALFSNSGILHNTSVPFFNQIVPQIEKRMLSDQDFSPFANLVNARYYLLRFDLDYKLRSMTDPRILERKLEERVQKEEVKKDAEFGKVQVWENLNWKDNTFYPAMKLITAKSIDKNPEIITSINILSGEVLVDSKDWLEGQVLQGKQRNDKLQISYEKIDTTKYLIHVKNASNSFILVFSELFNNDWRASYDNGHIIDKHFRANLYANGWLVDRNGEFDLKVEFSSQKWMYWGEIISILSFIFLLLLFTFILFRFKKAKI